MKVAYQRVSTQQQDLARQTRAFEELGIKKIFTDKASGKNVEREQLKAMLAYIREDDVVVVESISRIARNTKDLLGIIDLIFRKSNGAYLYGSTDVATIYERLNNYKIDNFLYFTDLRQGLHFEQVFRSCEILGLASRDKFEFCGFGTVNGTDGKPFKTRAGNSPKLDGLFKQVKEVLVESKDTLASASEQDLDILVNSIIKFADLQNNRERDYIFDIEKFSKISGKTGPYILYTYLRLNKILQLEDCSCLKYSNTQVNKSERELKIQLLTLGKNFNKAQEEKMPSYICDYIYNVCNYANTFYENNRIKAEKNTEVKNNWLALIQTTTKILKSMLNLLVIDIPSVM